MSLSGRSPHLIPRQSRYVYGRAHAGGRGLRAQNRYLRGVAKMKMFMQDLLQLFLLKKKKKRIQPPTRLRSCRKNSRVERNLLLLTASPPRTAVHLRRPEKSDRRQAGRSAKLMRDHRNRCLLSTSELWTSASSSSPTTSCSGGALFETPRDLAQKVAVGKLCEDCLQ